MKKAILVLCVFIGAVLVLSSCAEEPGKEIETYFVTEEPATNDNGEVITTDTSETEYFTDENGEVLRYNENGETEYVTIAAPSTDEMSPAVKDVTLPYEIEYQLTELKKLKVIDPEASFYPDSAAAVVYEKGNSQYFHYESGELLVITQKSDKSTYACFYNSDGVIRFCTDDTMSWYFDGDKNIEHVVYTYYNAYTRRNVYTFYSPEGERLYVGADGLYYDKNFDQLSGAEYDSFIIEYADTQEVVAGD